MVHELLSSWIAGKHLCGPLLARATISMLGSERILAAGCWICWDVGQVQVHYVLRSQRVKHLLTAALGRRRLADGNLPRHLQ